METLSMIDPARAVVGVLSVSALLVVALVAVVNVASWLDGRRFVAAERKDFAAYAQHLRYFRSDFLRSLCMREEAYLSLDGEGLDFADECLRDELWALGGLAAAW
jgi:hypothetical protein